MSIPDNQSPVILFVDDEATAVKYFHRAVGSLAPVVSASSVEEGKVLLDAHADTLLLLVSDQRMPGANGNELLLYAKSRHPEIVRILTTAYSELEQTVEAVNQGQIYRYIQKPWEISALRMELKQALELARLRRDHAQLLREKLMVRHQQVIANRIGALYTLCASLVAPQRFRPMEAYLTAASIVGVASPEPDWMMIDHADLVSGEALRAGELGYTLARALITIGKRFQDMPDGELPEALAGLMLPHGVKVSGDGSVLFQDTRIFTEFLEKPIEAGVSPAHADWLAFLLWLDGRGHTIQTTRAEIGLQCKLVKADGQIPAAPPETWIEQF